MKTIAILGTGNVAQAFATRLTGLNYQVVLGTRNVENTLANTTKDMYGTPLVSEFITSNPTIQLDSFENAARKADILILATKGIGAEPAMQSTKDKANGKLVIDVTNPLDFTNGFPPTLFTSNTSSLGEELQAKFPDVNFVKTLNTMYNGVMLNPRQLSDDSNVFLSGNVESAKKETIEILKQFGWKDSEIIDLGDITTARGTESLLPIWLRIYSSTQNGVFNFKIVK